MKTLKFNTGRDYSAHGQRIAATQLETGQIIFVDVDRHIDVMLPAGVQFNQTDIMRFYDLGAYIFPNEIGMSYSDYYDTVRQLADVAVS